jgi:hypothetical protein
MHAANIDSASQPPPNTRAFDLHPASAAVEERAAAVKTRTNIDVFNYTAPAN